MEQASKEISFEISTFTFDKTISLVCASEQFILHVTCRKDSTIPPFASCTRLLLNAVESDDTFEIGGRHPGIHCEESVHRKHLVPKHQMKT